MPWKTMDIQEQRVRFVLAAARKEKSLTALCREFQISRPTGYVWLRRYEESGIAGIAEKSRRPHSRPKQTPAESERQVVAVRKRYPDWGARKLKVVLAQQKVGLPRSTIHRILLRHHLVQPRECPRASQPAF